MKMKIKRGGKRELMRTLRYGCQSKTGLEKIDKTYNDFNFITHLEITINSYVVLNYRSKMN